MLSQSKHSCFCGENYLVISEQFPAHGKGWIRMNTQTVPLAIL
jgi:hypothetical protein